ncbi:MAG: deoxyguanosinetriphosphate triphosphohydrolase [Candidatus Saganbacteria bacterium]|nr:deoxyguanosinetriphosphate triphosphohydrolase [Candidatus Saganbacteria bacterium]
MAKSLREELEAREKKLLSPYAAKACATFGRKHPEKECDFRTAYQRDRDKIIHCRSFRRLKHKTQVFISPVEDHYRTRLTHTLEVAQFARTIARALRLNEDLTEAIALGHDLGHTPFGHSGEEVLDHILKGYGSHFKHNEQGVRVVEKLEKDGRGLNLTAEVVDGIKNHPFKEPDPVTLEGMLVRYADRVAYIRHDIEDALEAGIIKSSDLPRAHMKVLGKNILDTIIKDIIRQSKDKPQIKMSPKIQAAMNGLYNFLYKRVYFNSMAKTEETKIPNMIKLLFRHYLYHPENIPDYQKTWTEEETLEATRDFIAGMTDRYAINKFEELFVPNEWRSKKIA